MNKELINKNKKIRENRPLMFPMNIRPYTLLKELYEKEKYNVISHWMLIEVLSKIPSQYLKDI